ncbi:muscle-specific protein 300 kDa-like [Eriocheir sinensis]|uniref:muscle-specific protein 300 kDa-like n=1 Tax=Eriocheir sinensis TaxID=95602 RepID=UPI0021C60FCC|nr:muscle-specific protein 300 kDa-like [Eriocheir sinensis]
MTFWQENYGFVKEVYDFRCSKYLEWMDNIEAIIGKVMANTQYTAKEFKIIKDTFTSLCRDLDKEGTKSWLDMMLDKLSQHSNENEDNLSGRDKAVKAQEKKKLEAMIERHNGLMGPTMEAQSKVDHYSECYAFGDDIHPVMKVLNEQRHLSCKEIHPHNMDMCEDQIEKQEKVLRTIENQAPIYNELMRRGQKLKSNPNAPSFLEREIKKLEETWKDTNEKAQLRIALLNSTFKDWEVYEQQRQAIYTPIEALEEQFKTYKRIYDPKKGTDWLERKKKKVAEFKKQGLEIYEVIQKCFKTIVSLAGEDKREFMEKEILEIDERKTIIEKVDKTLEELTEFNKKLHKFVDTMGELRAWMMPACEKLNFITTSTEMSPEDRVKEIFDLQGQVNERLPLMEPLEAECHLLFDAKRVRGQESEEGQTNETALNHMKEFFTIKETINDLHEKVEMEAGSITQDQKYFADYLYGVKNFKPWMEEAETVAKTPLVKPAKIEDAMALLETVKKFEDSCKENRGKLDAAAESRSHMEKQTKADNEVETLNGRWDTVKKVADERVAKIQELCDTWSELQKVTNNLTEIIANVPGTDTPDVSSLEGIFKTFKEINDKKVKLLQAV